ncbi:glutathione S-transferase A-like [Argopecten irradians]|uniref:glutathione S-transferase A-like n=1 Tax=Argopecten irradians TaxID=31199 RepID=UPI0037226A47
MGKQMKLFWGSGSGPCVRAMIALFEKGFTESDVDMKLISFSEKQHKGDDVVALNPRGQVPTFKDGDTIVNESMAICLYLDKAYPNQGTKLLPDDPAQFAKVIQTAIEANENLQMKLLLKCIYFVWMTPVDKRNGDEYEKKLKEAHDEARTEMGRWEKKLKESGGEYICGKDFTLADIVLFSYVVSAKRFGSTLDNYPSLKVYCEKLSQRKSVQAAWPPHWKESELEPEKQLLKTI